MKRKLSCPRADHDLKLLDVNLAEAALKANFRDGRVPLQAAAFPACLSARKHSCSHVTSHGDSGVAAFCV